MKDQKTPLSERPKRWFMRSGKVFDKADCTILTIDEALRVASNDYAEMCDREAALEAEIERLKIWGSDSHVILYPEDYTDLETALRDAEERASENYFDLLDEARERGYTLPGQTLDGAELDAWLGSRRVHRPAQTLRERAEAAEKERDELKDILRKKANKKEYWQGQSDLHTVRQMLDKAERRATDAEQQFHDKTTETAEMYRAANAALRAELAEAMAEPDAMNALLVENNYPQGESGVDELFREIARLRAENEQMLALLHLHYDHLYAPDTEEG